MSSKLFRTNTARTLALVALASMSLGACASGIGANDYERVQAGQVNRVDTGVVIASRTVVFEGTDSGLGASTGAVIGGVAGSQIGGGSDERVIAGVVGAVLGGLIGAAVEEGSSEQTGVEYTIQLDRNDQLITIAQGDDVVMPNGTLVFVQYGQRARVVPQNSNVATATY